jgi:glycogen debranching enzyme
VRLYPTDEAEAQFDHEQSLQEVMQDALQRHAEGVEFRERNAGRSIDNDMCDAGFNNRIGVDWETGFVFGGNEHNCGTWMDKMGSSGKAGNHGKPATPRDGTAVELVGLSASVIQWLAELSEAHQYPHTGVKRIINGETSPISFRDWHALMRANFERHFWVGAVPSPDDPRPDLINRRAIYKDSCGASQPWCDYQLRPNFTITIALAPDLVDPEHAWLALETAEKVLMGPLGMKTLDPSDRQYHGNYVNSDDSHNYQTAKGFNYHQGPEWVWPVGFFLRATLLIAARLEPTRPGVWRTAVNYVKQTMSAHRLHLFESHWRSLPELTNANGADCPDSCMAQAWSVGCLLEVLYDMEQISSKLTQ